MPRPIPAAPAPSSPEPVACPRCGQPVPCDPAGACWCMALPPRRPVPQAGTGCLCPDCLMRDDAAKP
ncbi:hypothetical protein E2C05_26855 [Paracraurococcus ruber]|uniref:Cysteine-rich CWC n=1 Tax=Paracraurococcus ruber TaxID=77675 RepID=A0ABS1CSL8_9PROT|nr:hypothetical protein [Paracraurococcus ruber]TDG21928.1 hypothetical protein E2C05_26855 [Paracraurococcus ruber]